MRRSFKRAGYVVVAVLLVLAGASTATAAAVAASGGDQYIDNPRFDNPN